MTLIIVMAQEGKAIPKYAIADVLPINTGAGTAVYYPTFLIFSMAGAVDDLLYLTKPVTETDPDRPEEKRIVSARAYKYDFDKHLSADTLQKIRESEELLLVEISEADIEEI